ncbi:MAG: elongation factor G [Eubacteriales bacterium]|nr:elongation factor G [Eubacteriales bacterium]
MIRNVCLLSHGNAGKTSLTEAMLQCAGASERFGNVADGTTVTDFDPEEIKRQISISTSLAHCKWLDCKINIIDTPGYFDFVGEIMQGVRVADSAVILISAKSGVSVGTENSWNYCDERGLPRIIFVNKVDSSHAKFSETIQQVKDAFGTSVAPLQLPIKQDDNFIGFVDIVKMIGRKFEANGFSDMEIPADLIDEANDMHAMLVESVASTDDALMERFFNDDKFTVEEIKSALRKGIGEAQIAPLLCGATRQNLGVRYLLDCICDYFPSPEERPAEIAKDANDNDVEVKPLATEPLRALVFKTVADPYVGKMSYFKVFSGELNADSTVVNSRTGENEKIGHIFFMNGKKQIETKKATTGDLGVLTKLAGTKTGDTLCKPGSVVKLEGIKFPKPNIEMAIVPKAKGDEEKIAAGLNKLKDEDKTFDLYTNHETHQMIICGIGEQHLDILASKLKSKFAVDMDIDAPRVAYREAFRKPLRVEGKHKKQSGGHGQFGHVWIEFEPGTEDGLTFKEKVFGGSVPRNYFPAVEKGLQECMSRGVLAGYPVVSLTATLVDGSYHPVDSSEMAFKMAATQAYKQLVNASPVILEPIGHLEVIIPDDYMGDVIGDINKRRGKVLGMNPIEKGLSQVDADVPMAEMHKYATDLRSMSQSRGKFTFEFVRYEDAPSNIAEKVIAEAKKDKED